MDNRGITPVAALCALLLLCACSRKVYVPVQDTVYHTDTLYRSQLRVDSVYIRDSVAVISLGDTVRVAEYHYRDRTKLLRDTVRETAVDTVRVSVPVPVERPLSRRQRLEALAGPCSIALLVGACLSVAVIWLVRRRK